MKRTKIQYQQYITRKNHKRFKRSVLRSYRNSSQGRHGHGTKSKKKSPAYESKTIHSQKIELPPIISFLFSNSDYFSKQRPNIPVTGVLTLPKKFSLSQTPEDSYRFLKNLLYTLRFSQTRTIKIDYSKCEEIDLGASITMDIILKEYISYFEKLQSKHQQVPVQSIGAINIHNENVKRFLFSIGAHQTIRGINANYPSIITYPLRIGQKGTNIGQKEIESTKLVEHIEKCLSKLHRSLTQEARENFADIIGEVLTNAENHSSTDYRFSVGHFEVQENHKHGIGTFQFVIFNFGQTIYERLKDPVACTNKQVIQEMEQLSRKYTERLFLGIGKDKILEETLWTLYTLQDGVSCISPHRGNGTIRFIESFLELSGHENDGKSTMTLFSGNTKIIFDGKYHTYEKVNEAGERHKIISFNDSNDLDVRPDEKYVNFVNNFYPGTMLYARIRIKEENLENE